MHCTDVERPKAKKPHRCMSCGEGIAVGETYVRWRCYDGGDASTNKLHPKAGCNRPSLFQGLERSPLPVGTGVVISL